MLILIFASGLVRVVRRAVVRRLALARETVFRLDDTGPLELHLEGPTLRRAPPLEFRLRDLARGTAVALSPIRLGSRIRGAGKARHSLLACDIEHAGEYGLEVEGLGALHDPAAYSVVLMRPVRLRLLFLILGIVVGAYFFTFGVLSLVLGI